MSANRRAVTVISVVAVFVLAVALVVVTRQEPGVAVPPPGEVSADHVDGHPVFVVHDPDGAVRVLDAVSPHASFPKVLAWCASARAFEDLWHGSIFAPDGSWIGGPAPTGMATFEILERVGNRISVGDRRSPPSRDDRPDDIAEPGPRCDGRTALYGPGTEADPTVLGDLVVHEPPPPDSPLWYPTRERVLGEATPVPPGIWRE